MNDDDGDGVIKNSGLLGDLWKSENSDGGCSSLTILNISQGFSRVGQGSSHQEQFRFSNYNSCPTQFADNSVPVWALVFSLEVHYLRENPCTDPDVILFFCGPWPSRGCRNLGPSGPGPHES